jgi:hypothetical protein
MLQWLLRQRERGVWCWIVKERRGRMQGSKACAIDVIGLVVSVRMTAVMGQQEAIVI